MYFTCEVHNLRFPTIQALKQHDQEHHSTVKGAAAPKTEKPQKKRKSSLVKSLTLYKKSCSPSVIATVPKKYINIPEIIIGDKPGDTLQCHICKSSHTGIKSLSRHITTHVLEEQGDSKSDVSNFKSHQSEAIDIEYNEVKTDTLKNVEDDGDDVWIILPQSSATTPGDYKKSARPNQFVKKDVEIIRVTSRLRQICLFACTFCPRRFKTKDLKKAHIISEHEEPYEDSSDNESRKPDNREIDPDFMPSLTRQQQQQKQSQTQITSTTGSTMTTPVITLANTKVQEDKQQEQLYACENTKYSVHYNPLLPLGEIICYFCGYICPMHRIPHFERHIWKHTLERPFRCKICSTKCKSQEDVDDHVKTHHPSAGGGGDHRPYKCTQCGRTFKEYRTLTRHALAHTSHQPFVCDLCQVRFKRAGDLRRHLRSTHQIETQFKCSICTATYHRKDMFQRHMKDIHPGLEYTLPNPYKNEGMIWNNCTFTCKSCRLDFTLHSEYKSHRKNVHCDTRANYCSVCDFMFASGTDLRKHLVRRIHASAMKELRMEEPTKNFETEEEQPRPHFCGWEGCGKKYARQHHLTRHIKSHTGDRRHICGHCEQSFTRKDHLNLHMTLHGVKQQVCGYCQQSFGRKDHLKVHVKRVHAKEEEGLRKTCKTLGRQFNKLYFKVT